MKIRYGFVTNSSSTSFLIIYHGDKDKRYRLYKALGVIPGLGSIPIAQQGVDQIVRHLERELAEEEECYQEDVERLKREPPEEDDWWSQNMGKWHKDRVKNIKQRQALVERHRDGGAVVWLTEPIEDQGGTSYLFQQLDAHETKNGITIRRFEEER